MMERVLGGCSFGESLLFFGCRRRDQDYLYGRLLEQWAEQGVITLRTAFSREQASHHHRAVGMPSFVCASESCFAASFCAWKERRQVLETAALPPAEKGDLDGERPAIF